MADQKITELPIKGTSGINLADYLLGIDSAEGYQMLISDLAKKIVESYSGSSLAGSSRTLKNALDTIASNAGGNMATIESGTTASKAYAVGDYMVRNGQLYKVTAAIASGGTITVGTNVTAAAAADDIAGIGNKIGNTAMGTTATTITGAIKEHETDIGNMALDTTATDLTGAINEHEADISTLNGNSLIYKGTISGDMNDYTTPGIYLIGGTVPTNGPSGFTWSPVLVIKANTTIKQIAFGSSAIASRNNEQSWYRYNGTIIS